MIKPARLPFLTAVILLAFANSSYAQNDYPFQIQTSGTGAHSIIFIPGFSCSGSVWTDTKTDYEQTYRCYVLTMAGFAGTPPQDKITFSYWEQAIADYIRKNKIDKPVIIGHSMGGALAMALAADYPDLVAKIVVVDAVPCLAALTNPIFRSQEHIDCSAMISMVTMASNDQFYQMQKQSIKQLLADTSKQELVVSWSMASDRKTFGAMFCDFSNTDLRGKISKIQCPSMILMEPNFKNIIPAINEQFKNLKNADVRYGTKGLHFIMYDDREWYKAQLITFINQ